MKLQLVKLAPKYKRHLFEMMDEWYSSGEKIIPSSICKNNYHYFELYMDTLDIKFNNNGLVPDSTFFCLDEERDIFVGAVNIRHYLNEYLMKTGGHIGDGVRPSERQKGIATAIIGLALKECYKIGIKRVLMVCDKNNIGSAKSIIKNGGVLENEIISNNEIKQRYWIKIKEHFMKLNKEPFDKIKSGKKTIEIRINDEKRRRIKVNDIIVFSCVDNPNNKLTVQVKALYPFNSFRELYSTFDFSEFGCDGYTIKKMLDKTALIYTAEMENKYGVLGIKVELIQ